MENFIFKLNPLWICEEVDGSYVFLNGDDVIVLHSFEKEIFDYFDGRLCVKDVSRLLSERFINYSENEFVSFVENLVKLEILISVED